MHVSVRNLLCEESFNLMWINEYLISLQKPIVIMILECAMKLLLILLLKWGVSA